MKALADTIFVIVYIVNIFESLTEFICLINIEIFVIL